MSLIDTAEIDRLTDENTRLKDALAAVRKEIIHALPERLEYYKGYRFNSPGSRDKRLFIALIDCMEAAGDRKEALLQHLYYLNERLLSR